MTTFILWKRIVHIEEQVSVELSVCIDDRIPSLMGAYFCLSAYQS